MITFYSGSIIIMGSNIFNTNVTISVTLCGFQGLFFFTNVLWRHFTLFLIDW
jgi:hypothetical protein